MNKTKDYTRRILDRLSRKNDNDYEKSNNNSNMKTQATPNDSQSTPNIKQIRHFFENFEKHCAVYFEPVLLKDKRPVKRPLEFELAKLAYQNPYHKAQSHRPSRERLVTVPSQISQFSIQPKKGITRILPKWQTRELDSKQNKSYMYPVKRYEQKVLASAKNALNQYQNQKYRSLKTASSCNISQRRVLVSPDSLQPIENRLRTQRQSQNKKILLKRCESYQKYMLQRRPY